MESKMLLSRRNYIIMVFFVFNLFLISCQNPEDSFFENSGNTCVGDFTKDGSIGTQDLSLILSKVGSNPSDENEDYDLNSDGMINDLDVDFVSNHFGVCKGAIYPTCNNVDLNQDNKVSISDGLLLTSNQTDVDQNGVSNEEDYRLVTTYFGQHCEYNKEFQPPVVQDPQKLILNCEEYLDQMEIDDPLRCSVWQAFSIGESTQIPFANASYIFNVNLFGNDFNLWDTYKNYTGKGVKVHITDSAVDHTHEDLNENFSLESSRNYCVDNWESDNLPAPKNGMNVQYEHGTQTAGIIAAAKNNVGHFGLAFNATFSADNSLISGCSPWYNRTAKNVDRFKKDASIDLWSGSYGHGGKVECIEKNASGSCIKKGLSRYASNYRYQSMWNESEIRQAVVDGANLNNITYFKSSGNDGSMRGIDSNHTDLANMIQIHPIAALNSANEIFSYSVPGANVALAGYSGIISTFSNHEVINAYDPYGGTSAAAPAVTGVAALVLEALRDNSNLTDIKWYDLMWILISTANKDLTRQNHDNHYSGSISGQPRIDKVTNSYGLTHSLDFGFGVPNVHEAIKKAMAIKSTLGPMIHTPRFGEVSEASEIQPGSCQSKIISVDQAMQIWTSQVSLKINGTPLSKTAIFLTMPDGTQSMIKNNIADGIDIVKPILNNGVMSFELISGQTELDLNYQYNVRAPMGINSEGEWAVKVCLDSSAETSANYEAAEIQFHGFEKLNALESITKK